MIRYTICRVMAYSGRADYVDVVWDSKLRRRTVQEQGQNENLYEFRDRLNREESGL